jgi:RimJ/RimL family protein N-acetyltransferase
MLGEIANLRPFPYIPLIMLTELRTERLLLRRWRKADRPPFAALNADPRVMEYFLSTRTEAESNGFADDIERKIDAQGFGLWAVEVPGIADFIGYIGLNPPNFAAPFNPSMEIGWRLAHAHWGKGYATEGARSVLHHATKNLKLPAIVSFTATTNLRSRNVMHKIGLIHDPAEDFDHPAVPADHPLCRHVLYRAPQNRPIRP